MAGEFADVVIALRAQNEDLRRDLNEARNQIRGFASQASQAFGSLQTAGKGIAATIRSIGAAIALGGLTTLVKDSIAAASALVDTADSLGITTKALQELHFAAEQNGVAIGTIDGALAKLSKSAVEAVSNPRGDLASWFKVMGIDLVKDRDLLNDIPRLLGLVLAGSDRFGTSTEKNAARLALLGKGTAELGSLARNGAQALSEATKAFDENGLAISDEDLRRLDAAGDAFSKLGTTLRSEIAKTIAELNRGGLLNRTAEVASSGIEATFSVIQDSIHGIRDAWDEVTTGPGGDDFLSFLQGKNPTRVPRPSLGALGSVGPNIFPAVPPLVAPESAAARAQREAAAKAAEEANRRLIVATAQTRELQNALAALSLPAGFQRDLATIQAQFIRDIDAAAALKTAAEREQAGQQAVLKLTIETTKAEEEHTRALQESALEISKAQQALEIARLPASRQGTAQGAADAFNKFRQQELAANGDPDKLAAARKELDLTLQTVKEAQARAESFTEFLKGAAAGAISDFGRQLSDSFLNADFSFKTFARTFLAGVARMIVEATTLFTIKKALEGVGGAIGGSIGGVLSGIAGAVTLGSGGVVTKPTFAMVGERGPEAVIPLDRLGSGGGGDVQVIIENHGQPLNQTGAQQSQNGQQRRIRVFVENSVSDSISSGRTVGRSMEATFGVSRAVQRRG